MYDLPVTYSVRAKAYCIAVIAAVLLALACVVRADVKTIGTGDGIAANAGVCRPGDTLQLSDGTYPGGKTIKYLSGTETAPITIRAVNSGKAVIEGGDTANSRPDALVLDHCNWIVLEGITFRDAPRHGLWLPACTHITLKSITSDSNGMSGVLVGGASDVSALTCTFTSNGEHGFYGSAYSPRLIVRGCTCTANAKAGIQFNGGMYFVRDGLIEGCDISRNGRLGGGAVNMLHTFACTIRKNNIHDNLAGGISIANGSGSDDIPIVADGNTITFAYGVGGQCGISAGGSTASFTNNICTVGRKINALQAYDNSTLIEEGNIVSTATATSGGAQ